MDIEEKNYLWQHFALNAEQRLKTFNFFVVLSVFANGGVFAADKNSHGLLFVPIGGFVSVLSIVFWAIDARSKALLELAIPGLKEFEKQFPEHSRLFALDDSRPKKYVRYTCAFRALFVLQLLFGLGVVGYGAMKWCG